MEINGNKKHWKGILLFLLLLLFTNAAYAQQKAGITEEMLNIALKSYFEAWFQSHETDRPVKKQHFYFETPPPLPDYKPDIPGYHEHCIIHFISPHIDNWPIRLKWEFLTRGASTHEIKYYEKGNESFIVISCCGGNLEWSIKNKKLTILLRGYGMPPFIVIFRYFPEEEKWVYTNDGYYLR